MFSQNCRESAVTVTNILGLDHLTFADINEDNLLFVRQDLLDREKSPSTFNRYYRDLKTVWSHAHKRNFVIGSNPFRKEIIAKVPPSRLVSTVTPEYISALDLFELLLERSKEVLGDFGEYLNDNCQLGFYKSFINQDLHNFLSEKESIPNQRQ